MTVARTPRAQRTEEAFLDAARRVFAAKGFRNARIVDIAEAARRSPGSFYNYWDNKEQLLLELIAQFPRAVLHDVLDRPRGRVDMREVIDRALRSYWRTYRDYLPEIIGIYELSLTDERFLAIWRRNRQVGVDLIVGDIRRAQRRGHARGKRPEVLASALVSMLDGFFWTWNARGGEDGVEPPDEDEVVAVLGDIWFRAIYG